MSRRPVVNRQVPAALPPSGPKPNRSVPPAARARPRFSANFFRDAHIVRTQKHPDHGLELDRGEIVLTPIDRLGALSGNQSFHCVIFMNNATYDLVTNDDDALSKVQDEIADWPRRENMGVKAHVADVSDRPSFGAPPAVVDRQVGGRERADELEVFVEQVLNLFTDIQGFDMSRMTGETRLEFFNRYGLLRDKAKKYRTLMANLEGAFEVLQKKMMELAE